ncbi:MAG: TatD family hydrolase, partial [Bacteroidetes bacterium]|nr:TatD family hydrolase [Bacteroidota bacterium]
MKLQLIDTHTHLFSEQFNIDRADAVQRALEVGISHLLLPNIDTKSIPAIRNAIQQFDACYGMMGLHPCSVSGNYKQDLKTIEAEFENEKYIAVGEIGLDYYWDNTFRAEQLKALEIQLEWAKERGLPAIIHTRESFNDAIALVEKCQNGDLKGIFHCFGGTVDEGKRAIDAGFYLGIGGNSTFKK